MRSVEFWSGSWMTGMPLEIQTKWAQTCISGQRITNKTGIVSFHIRTDWIQVSLDHIWEKADRYRTDVASMCLSLAEMLAHSVLSSLLPLISATSNKSYNRLAPPSAHKCSLVDCQRRRNKGRLNGWFRIMSGGLISLSCCVSLLGERNGSCQWIIPESGQNKRNGERESAVP